MAVVSKNLFDLLGNDVEDSSSPAAPVKTVEKASTHTTKRNADGAAPTTKAPVNTGARRAGPGGNEGAFRDRQAGSDRNRGKPTDEAPRGDRRGGFGARGRGGRGGRFPRTQDDRHSKSGNVDTEKATAAGWGAAEGDAELKDEQAGEAIAQAEKKEGDAEATAEVPEEEEDKHITLDQYLAQVAEQKLALEAAGTPALRKANEGVKENKKWATAKALTKDDGEDYFAGTGGKAKRERERKVKQVVEIDQRYVEPDRGGGRGGRGGPRGGGRGDGARGDGARGRGRGAPRGGDFRGGRGGNRGESTKPINANDESAFPSLGGK